MSAPVTETQTDTSAIQTITVPEGTRYAARVKWFDNTMNYGFATVLEGEHTGKDIFVHQSNILTLSKNVYRSLRAGEYIEFALEETTGNEHKHQAVSVTGPRKCPLMCETNPQRRRPNFNGGRNQLPLGFVAVPAHPGYGRGGFRGGRGRGGAGRGRRPQSSAPTETAPSN